MRRLPVLLVFVFALTALNSFAQTTAPAIALGNRHAVALRTNGEVLTWGENLYCQLGRGSRGNSGRTPVVVMRNAKQVAAASDHTLVLTEEGKVYGWGMNPEGALGTANTNDQCEGPELIESLASERIAQIATGNGFSVAVTAAGDLYCAGDNSQGQCPGGPRTGRVESFTKLAIPELAGNVADVRAGAFHTLILTKDRKLYALGRGRDGQLGHGKTVNGFAVVPEMTDVVSFAAGTWHSVAARADGSVWTWGNNAKSQLCDAPSPNRTTPTRVTVPEGARVAGVAAGGHATLLLTPEGRLFACGDNQFDPLGIAPPIASQPTAIAVAPVKSQIIAVSGSNGAFSPDGCSVHLVGSNATGIVAAADTPTAKTFTPRQDLTLCAPRLSSTLGDVVNPAPKGGLSGCWTARKEEDGAASPRFAGLREAMLAVEETLKKNAALMAAPQPVRWRTSMSAGPSNDGGARMHVAAIAERKTDGTRVWSTGCEVIPQVDRIGGSIAQVSIFFNTAAGEAIVNNIGEPPKQTGTVGGYPEYNGWVLITKDKRVPWIPQTLAERLDEEGRRRERALDEAKRRPAGIVGDAEAGGLQWLEKQVLDYQQYRASFTADELRSAAVWGDPGGEGRKKLDAEIAELRKLNPADQQQVDSLGLESRNLERQAQAEVRNKNTEEATRLRERSRELALKVREIRQAHQVRSVPLILDASATYELKSIQSGPAERAMRVKTDPRFPDTAQPNRIQVIAVMLSFGPRPAGAMLEWQNKVRESLDVSALAALLR